MKPAAREEPRRGNHVRLELLCPSCRHMQPSNCTPPAFSPHYPETLYITQFISLSSPFICSHRCSTGGSISSRAFITSEWWGPSVASHWPLPQPCSPQAGQHAPYVADDYNGVAGQRAAAAAAAAGTTVAQMHLCVHLCLCCIKYVIKYKLCKAFPPLTVNLNIVSATPPYYSAFSTPGGNWDV